MNIVGCTNSEKIYLLFYAFCILKKKHLLN